MDVGMWRIVSKKGKMIQGVVWLFCYRGEDIRTVLLLDSFCFLV